MTTFRHSVFFAFSSPVMSTGLLHTRTILHVRTYRGLWVVVKWSIDGRRSTQMYGSLPWDLLTMKNSSVHEDFICSVINAPFLLLLSNTHPSYGEHTSEPIVGDMFAFNLPGSHRGGSEMSRGYIEAQISCDHKQCSSLFLSRGRSDECWHNAIQRLEHRKEDKDLDDSCACGAFGGGASA